MENGQRSTMDVAVVVNSRTNGGSSGKESGGWTVLLPPVLRGGGDLPRDLTPDPIP